MKYLITTVFFSVSCCFMLFLGRIAYLAVTDDLIYIIIGLAVLMPTIVSILITSAAYSAAKTY